MKQEIASSIKTAVTEKYRPVVITCKDKDFTMYNFNKPYATAPYDSLMQLTKISTSKPIWFFLITDLKPNIAETIFINNNQLILVNRINNQYLLYRN